MTDLQPPRDSFLRPLAEAVERLREARRVLDSMLVPDPLVSKASTQETLAWFARYDEAKDQERYALSAVAIHAELVCEDAGAVTRRAKP